MRVIFVIVGVISVVELPPQILTLAYMLFAVAKINETPGVIGGEDKPSYIYLSGMPSWWMSLVLTLVFLVAAIIGICKTRRRK